MQYLFDVHLVMSFFAGVSSVFISFYLLYRWTKYENRLLTDLPLMIGITTLLMSVNLIVVNAISAGYIPDTLEVFKWRSVLIGGIVLPLFQLLLHIWMPKRRKYHPHLVVLLGIYWVVVSIFGPSREVIMILNIPFLLIFLIGMSITFMITWKTKRLKEIRSEFAVFGAVFIFISQVSKVWLMSFGLAYISDLFTAIGILCLAIAAANPRVKQEQKPDSQIPLPTVN